MPDYQGDERRPFDVVGLVLFGTGVALLSWLLEMFGEHHIDGTSAVLLLGLSLALLGAYGFHAKRIAYPLLRLSMFRIRTFRVSVLGGFVTRLGLGGMPFLLPLLYQIGMGLPAWQSGLLMMPAALAAMGMKVFSVGLLRRFGYRRILIVNTVTIGVTICLFSFVGAGTPVGFIVALGLVQGFFNSMQFSSINTMAYADIGPGDSSMASSMASTMQQISMSFGLVCGSIATAFFLGDLPQSDRLAVTGALHDAFLTLGVLTMLSSLTFWTLRPGDGDSVSRGGAAA
jgi:MFS family permease